MYVPENRESQSAARTPGWPALEKLSDWRLNASNEGRTSRDRSKGRDGPWGSGRQRQNTERTRTSVELTTPEAEYGQR
jgi:hypothetical protein